MKCTTCKCVLSKPENIATGLCQICRDWPNDPVNRPAHYTYGKIECVDVIEDWGFADNWYRGNAIKYLCRAGRKGDKVQDLRKAIWYIEREIEA
jgi:hypothetical protein